MIRRGETGDATSTSARNDSSSPRRRRVTASSAQSETATVITSP